MRYPLLQRAAESARVLAAAGSLAVAGRFAFVGVLAVAPRIADEETAEAAARPRDPAPLRTPTDAGPPPKPRQSLRMTFSVLVGGDRAEVFIGGRRVGLTPFVGDITCRHRTPIKVEVLPREGPPLLFTRRCRSGVARITEPDPPGVEVP